MDAPHRPDPAVTAMTADPAAYFATARARARADARRWVRRLLHPTA